MFDRIFNSILGRNVSVEGFIEAAKNGDLEIVNRYIQANRNNVSAINAVSFTGDTALIWAAFKGHTTIAAALLAKEGIATNIVDRNGWSALICAASRGHIAIVMALLAKEGLVVNASDHTGCTALIFAARRGHIDVVKALLPKLNLVDILHQSDNYCAAKDEAEEHGHPEIVALIVARELALQNGDTKVLERRAALTPQDRLERIKFPGEVDPDLVCPIGQDDRVMLDPVTVSSGETFERKNLIAYFRAQGNPETVPCPVTRQSIHRRELGNAASKVLKRVIDNFVKAEEEKDAIEKQEVKEVMNALVQHIATEGYLAHSSKNESAQEENVCYANDPSSSSSSSFIHAKAPETEIIRVIKKRKPLEFFESQHRKKPNNNDDRALSSNTSYTEDTRRSMLIER